MTVPNDEFDGMAGRLPIRAVAKKKIDRILQNEIEAKNRSPSDKPAASGASPKEQIRKRVNEVIRVRRTSKRSGSAAPPWAWFDLPQATFGLRRNVLSTRYGYAGSIMASTENGRRKTGREPHRLIRTGNPDESTWRTFYFAFIKATVVSSMRLKKPHSLSYQDETLTSRPLTLVKVKTKKHNTKKKKKTTDTNSSLL